MTQAKLEPGEPRISLAGKRESDRAESDTKKESDPPRKSGIKQTTKRRNKEQTASPLDPGIDLGG
ncbi:hypothetical protein EKL30_14695 [Candidimonas sp. SYP-B2681]|uniref:hypothetical protein n=1 Tax=Candidimonas sp. SYP-B2681 TaxID=2497686 RepID=UPI000F894083|nr:hypothetical protein [Candidimonas sp. SYP-B2681]RTZ40942.1 hypothetical protein EKL30_14695 [Candidimonas sp. SYP-B2681]